MYARGGVPAAQALSAANSTCGNAQCIAPSNAELKIFSSTFTLNTAPYGGAIAAVGDAKSAPVEIHLCTFQQNQAQYVSAASEAVLQHF